MRSSGDRRRFGIGTALGAVPLLASALVLATLLAPPAAARDFPLPPLPNEADIYPFVPVPVPAKDTWYDDPADFGSLNNGDIIRTREIQTYFLAIPIPVYAKQLLYRSTDARGNPLATATTVLVPGIPWIGPGERPLISYQEAIDGLGSHCNPSFTIRTGLMKETSLMGQFLAAGMAVTMPDFDGKKNTIMSPSEGYMVLDGIRATQRAGMGLERAPIGMWGYSGGGNSTASAAEAHGSYAPELNIRASAQGGVPGDKVEIAPFAMSGKQFQANFTGWLAVSGLAREYPDFDEVLRSNLTEDGLRVLEDLSDRCLYTTFFTTLPRPVGEYLKDQAVLQNPVLQRVLRESSLGQPAVMPRMPILMWHSTTDQLLPAEFASDPVAAKYCAAGVELRYIKVPATEHISAEIIPELGTVAWLTAVVAGADPGPRVC
ncbi:lipase family protein [Antrihabitans sp. NCIMB 15449]|uniref:Lipase family protein n=1 Tax=Antrihabitans spumae TaxID=3373370 RepID=A0ABW7JFL6_9NOCA